MSPKKAFLILLLVALIIPVSVSAGSYAAYDHQPYPWLDGQYYNPDGQYLADRCQINGGEYGGMFVYDKMPYESSTGYISMSCPLVNTTYLYLSISQFWSDALSGDDLFLPKTQAASLASNGGADPGVNLTGSNFYTIPTSLPNYKPNESAYMHMGILLVEEVATYNFTIGLSWELVSREDFLAYDPVELIVSVSETGNFTKKLSGVEILLSDDAATSETTGADGTALLVFDSGSYNYAASKDGYHSLFGALGGYGEDGGTLYLEMDPYTPPPPTDVSMYVTAWDPAKSTTISNAIIGIYNLTESTWQNWSAPSGVAYFDSTGVDKEYPLIAGESVVISASALGYVTGYGNITIPYDAYAATLNLVSTSDAPIGTNATLSVVILDNWASTPIEGGTITIVNETAGFARSRVSDAVGTVLFPNINSGRYQVTAASTGYQTASTFADLIAGETELISFSLVHIGATPVVTDTAGVAQYDEDGNPIIGYDAYGNPITAGPTPDIRPSSERQQALMDDLLGWAEILIPICCIMTLLYIMGYKP